MFKGKFPLYQLGQAPVLTLRAANGLEIPYAVLDFKVAGVQIPGRGVVIVKDDVSKKNSNHWHEYNFTMLGYSFSVAQLKGSLQCCCFRVTGKNKHGSRSQQCVKCHRMGTTRVPWAMCGWLIDEVFVFHQGVKL